VVDSIGQCWFQYWPFSCKLFCPAAFLPQARRWPLWFRVCKEVQLRAQPEIFCYNFLQPPWRREGILKRVAASPA
jgi:hypothetical protein